MLKFSWPSRIVVVGGSSTGKTYLVWQMILRNNFGGVTKKSIEIVITSPVEASVDQRLWQDLKHRGYDIRGAVIKKSLPAMVTEKPKRNKYKLLIIDDIDHISHIAGGKEWLLNLFGTESHHSNITVVLIAHHLNIGCPAIKNSSDAIILTGLPPSDLKKVCMFLGMSKEEEDLTREALHDPAGALEKNSDTKGKIYQQLYNHVVVWRKAMYSVNFTTGTSEAAPTLYSFNNRSLDRPSFLQAL